MFIMMDMSTICRSCTGAFEITDEDRAFLKNLAPVIAGKTYALPEPTLCPDCRQQRRQAAVNQIHLHRNICGLTGKPVISNFRKDSGYTVYAQDAWWSDAWDPLSFGREFDFCRQFG